MKFNNKQLERLYLTFVGKINTFDGEEVKTPGPLLCSSDSQPRNESPSWAGALPPGFQGLASSGLCSPFVRQGTQSRQTAPLPVTRTRTGPQPRLGAPRVGTGGPHGTGSLSETPGLHGLGEDPQSLPSSLIDLLLLRFHRAGRRRPTCSSEQKSATILLVGKRAGRAEAQGPCRRPHV